MGVVPMIAIPTKFKLAAAIRQAAPDGRLEDMARKAEAGHYDDFESELEAPCVTLVRDLRAAGAEDLAKRAMNGEWDGTKEEAEAWARSKDGQETLSRLPPAMRKVLGAPTVDETGPASEPVDKGSPIPEPAGSIFKAAERRQWSEMEELAGEILLSATELFGHAAKQKFGRAPTGFSFVTLSLRLWAAEIAELDKAAARSYLYALGDAAIAPTPKDFARAEKRRQEAWDRLAKALDLQMAEPGGTA